MQSFIERELTSGKQISPIYIINRQRGIGECALRGPAANGYYYPTEIGDGIVQGHIFYRLRLLHFYSGNMTVIPNAAEIQFMHTILQRQSVIAFRIGNRSPGNTDHNGIVLVGGNLTGNGNNTIYGATFMGLNIMLGQTIGSYNDIGNGTKTYQYDSCEISNALHPFAGWQRLGNATVDNWPSY